MPMNRASFGKLMTGGSKMKYGKKKAVKKVKKPVKKKGTKKGY
jgi:hypothetical protein